MLSKNQIKLIKSLGQKKYRQQYGLFIVEGVKGVEEFLNSDFEINAIYATDERFNNGGAAQFTLISEAELKKISHLKSPNTVLALVKTPNVPMLEKEQLIVALDAVNDPGNLGTIIRLCDWYGVKTIICSTNTVDCFNPKVVQATMGSLTRVNLHYLDLEAFLSSYKGHIAGTYMQGENIYTAQLPKEGLVIFGNEANGISAVVTKLVNARLSIPQFGSKNVESLNVAAATAITLSEYKRRFIER